MENASKALMMAASVLLGLMIISVGVALFNSFAGSGSNIMSKIEETQIAEFNNQFLKYYGETTQLNEKTNKYETQKIKITAHDIVTLVNLAKKNNIKYEVEEQSENSENSNYVQITLNKKYRNMEKQQEDVLTDFIQDNNMIYNSENELVTKYYYINNVKVSEVTKRVIYIEIDEFK